MEKATLTPLCLYCFDTLTSYFKKAPMPDFPADSPFANKEVPLFVTWQISETENKKSPHAQDLELRGCIGTFEDQKVADELGNFALLAALEDDRFEPLSKAELPRLSVTVSLLENFCDKSNDLEAWEVGVNGVQIEFTLKGREYEATFLPEVMVEEGWSKHQTMLELVRKAGVPKRLFAKIKESIKLTTYESRTATLSFKQYLTLREQQ